MNKRKPAPGLVGVADGGIIPSKKEEGPLYRQYNLARLKEIIGDTEKQFRRDRDQANAELLSQHVSKYLHLVESALFVAGIIPEESLAIYELQKLLDLGRRGKKHPFTHQDAPSKPNGSPTRARIEAEAAAVLGCALAQKQRIQAKWLRNIQEVLEEGGYFRPATDHRPSAPYSADVIRKWHDGCVGGTHPESTWYVGLLLFVYKHCESTEYPSYDPTFAIERLRYVVSKGRW
jgi:hypothetical protein